MRVPLPRGRRERAQAGEIAALRIIACLCLTLAAFAAGAGKAASKASEAALPRGSPRSAAPKADKETVEFVGLFLKSETSSLPPEGIPKFLAVDPASLPSFLRVKCRAKQTELRALMRISQGKKKAPLRRISSEEKARCSTEEGGKQYIDALRAFGFDEIYDDEERFLMDRTRCTECELQEESSFVIVAVPPKKKGELPERRLFMSQNDPFFAIITAYRKKSGGQTDFFSIGFHGACR